MVIKNGFLLIELMIGLTLSLFLILIITHYIIEVKNVQQVTLARIEALSFARNTLEKLIAHSILSIPEQTDTKKFTVNITDKSFAIQLNNQQKKIASPFIMQNMTIAWMIQEKKQSITIEGYFSAREKNET